MFFSLSEQKQQSEAWFRQLRDRICADYEALEAGYEHATHTAHFERKIWSRPEGGGGEMSIMKGPVFEKVGVNISTVWGEFSEAFRKEIPGAATDPRYWATGISLVAHPRNPYVPAAHFNTRMITTGDGVRLWFGGGGDLNPMIENQTDIDDFHTAFENACAPYAENFYPAFKDWCDEYFYIPHRQRPRGAGGIFYDYLGLHRYGTDRSPIDPAQFGRGGLGKERTRAGMLVASDADLDWNTGFAFTKNVGEAFAAIYPEIIRRRWHLPYGEEERQTQLIKRGWYAEYNLLYDRGTRFGLMTGGNTEAILMSLPPEARWP